MARHRGPLLVDTNVILECWRIGAWGALSGGYPVETVEDCVTETQTGFQNRRAEEAVDATTLRTSLAHAPHPVTALQLAALDLAAAGIQLDPGERSLWAHALERQDAWVVCGPDRASLRVGVRLGFRDRLVALETLLTDAGYRPRTALKRNYTAAWHAQTVGEYVVMEREAHP
jgi:hypothetical protein